MQRIIKFVALWIHASDHDSLYSQVLMQLDSANISAIRNDARSGKIQFLNSDRSIFSC
jgi:hypothetical protein